jgi:hypothetical protein
VEVVAEPWELGANVLVELRGEATRQVQAEDRIQDPADAAVADLDGVTNQAAVWLVDQLEMQPPGKTQPPPQLPCDSPAWLRLDDHRGHPQPAGADVLVHPDDIAHMPPGISSDVESQVGSGPPRPIPLVGLPRVWLTSLTPGGAGREGCLSAQEVPSGVQA